MFAAAAAASAAGCACPHLAALDKHGFRGLLRRRFCSRDDDGDSACGDGQKHELSDNFVSTTVAGIARASASVHHKAKGSDLSGGKRTNMLLHCEACAGLDGGRNRDALARVRARARASQIGGLCTSDLWVCMHCALCLDREHALAHAAASPKCHLFISCHDAHVFCSACRAYQYPRELGGSQASCAFLDPIVYEWLLVYGRMRLWWRSIDNDESAEEGGARNMSAGLSRIRNRIFGGNGSTIDRDQSTNSNSANMAVNDCVGLKNFGNTCFFTSTCQALLATPVLVQAIMQAEPSETSSSSVFASKSSAAASSYPVQRALRNLIRTCHTWTSGRAHDPRRFFTAVQDHAVFGHYDDNTMEDARSLLLDISETLDPKLKKRLFDFGTEQCISCCACGAQGDWQAEYADPIITVNVTPLEHPAAGEDAAAASASAGSGGAIAAGGVLTASSKGNASAAEKRPQKRMVHPMSLHEVGLSDPPADLFSLIKGQFIADQLEGYKCDKCKSKDTCTRVRRAKSLPLVLVVQIKRSYNGASFEGSADASISIKCHRRVVVPTRIDAACLKVSGAARAAEAPAQILYELCAVNVHDGGIGGGHNMCYRRDCTRAHVAEQGSISDLRKLTEPPQWTWFSDRFFGPVTPEEVAAAEPSLAFYMRVTPKEHGEEDQAMGGMVGAGDGGGSGGGGSGECLGGCGFFGREENGGYCSKCA
jgi:hypothetical protein